MKHIISSLYVECVLFWYINMPQQTNVGLRNYLVHGDYKLLIDEQSVDASEICISRVEEFVNKQFFSLTMYYFK